ncbi:magnesium chelatase subunit H [Gemmatimonas sp.]|uniref:magnesium chelatase subunit H n=1 Tax=Gemmatimonas sp. TaxID=1962908 RepID=UPI003561364A
MAAKKNVGVIPIRVAITTLDAHLADAFGRAGAALTRDIPGLTINMHVAADFGSDPQAAERARQDIAQANIVVCTQLFQEEYANAVYEAVLARRDQADAVLCALCTPELVKCTKLGKFDMSGGESRSPLSPINLLKKLRGSRGDGKSSGERQMTALRTLPSILKFIPGTAQDVRAYLLLIQYWLAGTSENIEQMVKYAIDRYADGPRKALRGALNPQQPQTYPEVGLWHPSLPERGIVEKLEALPRQRGANVGTVGVLVGRSYLLADNVAHYAAVVAALESKGLRVVAAFASALDARPAVEKYFTNGAGQATIDTMINLTGFSLVGGPAYNNSEAAQEVLRGLDVPYLTLQTLEFQTIQEWRNDARGLNPLQATLQIAIPELDGAIIPTVFGGKGEPQPGKAAASEPIPERIERVAERVAKMVALRRKDRSQRKIALILFNFPPNAGNTGSAAYLAVFPSMQRVLASLKEQGYSVDLPASADDLRERITGGNRERYGAPANVHTTIRTDDHVRRELYLAEIEKTWGPAPGRQLSDGQSIQIMGLQLGNVFIGVQPSFGWEGDPMRLLFEGGFSPTHAFSAFYRWLREDYAADAILHFGTHGALEFMPGKQSGLDDRCWPDRLIGDAPNVYLYASNNSSEGTLAKRRGNATLVSYLTPPVANAGLYRGLLDLKSTLDRWRALDQGKASEAASLRELIQQQAAAVELAPAAPAWSVEETDARVTTLRDRLLELEYSLIPMGLHVVGEGMKPEARVGVLVEMARSGRPELDLPAIGDTIVVGQSTRNASDDTVQLVERIVRASVQELVDTKDVRSAERKASAEAKSNGLRIADDGALRQHLEALTGFDKSLSEDREVAGILRALDARYVSPAPGGDLLRNPAVLPTGRNIYGFDPYRVPSAVAMLEGRVRAEQLLTRYVADHGALPESVAVVLWGTDNMKSEGTPLAQVMSLMGVVPRFDAVGRLTGARLLPLTSLARPRVDVVVTLSGIFRDLLPLQVKLLAEAALICAQADEDPTQNFIRKHALQTMQDTGCDLATAALRVFSNADGAYGSNVNLLIDTGKWEKEDELADLFVQRKGFAYGTDGRPSAQPALMKRALGQATLSFQGLDSVDLGATDIDQYVESLGGMTRVIAQQNGGEAPAVYLGDYNNAQGKVRTLTEQVELESRTKLLNPRWYESQLEYGYEGARNIAGHVITTFGWSATGGKGAVPEWVYAEATKTFVLDEAMRERLAQANPDAASGLAQRLLEANDRGYWSPDEATLEALRNAAADLEDRLEGVFA